MLTISLVSTKWSETAWPLLAHASRALAMTAIKLRKSVYSSTRARSRADQNSWPSALTRLIRSKVLLAAGVGSGLLMAFLLPEAKVQMKHELFTRCTARTSATEKIVWRNRWQRVICWARKAHEYLRDIVEVEIPEGRGRASGLRVD